ncbi:ankyrin repeat-containing protein [Turbot reddish body iridovirus]|uniref:Ankyrin repeat-containing protein n=1 Tax=Turbot reddish body iridovirus TaxID=273651 RepID=E2CU54_ISKNV|nr:ankyrin repeat-containing protein [Turbot reddish body iridovirus]
MAFNFSFAATGDADRLLWAIRYDTSMAMTMLQQGQSPNINNGVTTALMAAAQHNNTVFMAMMRHPGINLNAADSDGNTVLHMCCRWVQYTRVKALLSAGANVDPVNKEGKTPLMYALHSKTYVHLLIQHGANPNHKDHSNHSVLYHLFSAPETHNSNFKHLVTYPIMAQLLYTGAARISTDDLRAVISCEDVAPQCLSDILTAPDIDIGYGNDTDAVCWAAAVGNLEAMKTLIHQFQYDVMANSASLLSAAITDDVTAPAVFPFVLEQCDVDALQENGDSALSLALQRNCMYCARALVANNVGIHVHNPQAVDRLLRAFMTSQDIELVRSLVRHTDIDLVHRAILPNGLTPLQFAATHIHGVDVDFLMAFMATVFPAQGIVPMSTIPPLFHNVPSLLAEYNSHNTLRSMAARFVSPQDMSHITNEMALDTKQNTWR